LNIAVSADQKWMAVTNNGQSVHSIQLIDPIKEQVLDQVIVPKAWYGLAFNSDASRLYASGGNDNRIWVYAIGTDKKMRLTDSLVLGDKWPKKISPSGLELDEQSGRLYVVTKEDKALYGFDLKTKEQFFRLQLPGEAYACKLDPSKKQLFVSCWGCDQVLVIDVAQQKIVRSIPVGDNPNEILFNRSGRLLFVANANDNSISVIDVEKEMVIEVLNTALYPDAPIGSAPNGLALSKDERTLYVANADNNSLAVFDISKPGKTTSRGFIPVGWYPTHVKRVGKKLFVSNGKGFTSMANPYGPNPLRKREEVIYQKGDTTRAVDVQYIAGLFKGTMSVIDEPNAQELKAYTAQVYQNVPYTKERELTAIGESGNPIPMKVGDPSPIKHVFYIIKENRTYDQVLSDLPGGNGDTSLLLFGRNITPNLHRLAEEFVLLDNFYVDAEVSADGHNWSMSANAVDYLEKTWPTNYGGRGGSYDAEGNRAIANPKKGFIWDYCQRAGKTYRSYGEFADKEKVTIPALKGHSCASYVGWDMEFQDTARFYQWRHDFDSLLAIHAVPAFNTVRFGNDHTEGLRIGKRTPFAHVADNDLAVGLFVEHLSKSPIWKESVVFVLEDDAQNGSDHVDAHRSTAYVVGPHVKRRTVDHTMYSTSSMLRTMELILGLPPMSQYDAAATPMWRCFTAQADQTAYTALPTQINLNERNTKNTPSARLSDKMDFSKEDTNDDLVFNEVIWKAVKGEYSRMPAPRRSAFLWSDPKQKKADRD
jgi:YVTN family beta-propeller protein